MPDGRTLDARGEPQDQYRFVRYGSDGDPLADRVTPKVQDPGRVEGSHPMDELREPEENRSSSTGVSGAGTGGDLAAKLGRGGPEE